MQWKHKVSLAWMEARQRYLTATEAKSLLPFTKTDRKRTVTDDDYFKILSSKMVKIMDDDCWSYGPAARGHILEPYAIEAYNEWARHNDKPVMFHWDDLIYPNEFKQLAFSPDALNIAPLDESAPTALAEVKCYGADRHLATAYTYKMKLDERWQIAVALAVEENIDTAFLVLFNPSMKDKKLFIIEYSRKDLANEIDIIDKIANRWRTYKMYAEKHQFKSTPHDTHLVQYDVSEEDIIAELSNRLNP